jgi:catechol 2,3-dioxygenase-like lactoylglutathione lyase family enzyme
MIRLGHLAIPVRDHVRSREWYVNNFGFKVEIEVPKLYWGYGAELRDPDGYVVGVWDEHSMREKGGS